MSQHDMILANADGASFRADLNAALAALASTSKGSTRPSTIYAGQLWLDDNSPSSSRWTLYLYDGSDDIAIGEFDTSANVFYATAPTAATDTNTTQVATTAFVLNQAANQATVEAISSTSRFVTPRYMQYHPGVAKAWGFLQYSAGVPTLLAGFNVASITDSGTGDMVVVLSTAFSGGDFAVTGGIESTGFLSLRANSAAGIRIRTYSTSGVLTDLAGQIHFTAFGDQ